MNAGKAKKGTESKDMAKAEGGSSMSAVVVSDQLPEYLKQQQGSARGRENVGIDDLVIPRLEVIQDLSPARKKQDPNYIPGAEEGMLYNNVTRELYGTEVLVVPVGFVKEWLLWKDRDKGGGFGGAYASEQLAIEARNELEDGEDYEVVDTNQQFCLLIKPDGSTEEIVVSMAKSKAKVSRKWNSLIRIANGDSFSRVYKIKAVADKNKQNQDFFNIDVSAAGFPAEPVYRKAERMYQALASGTVKADRSTDTSEPTAGNGTGEY